MTQKKHFPIGFGKSGECPAYLFLEFPGLDFLTRGGPLSQKWLGQQQ
jgi:hypothetical protein